MFEQQLTSTMGPGDTQIGDERRDDHHDGDEVTVRTMSSSPNGKTVASGSQDGIVKLWDVETGKVVVKWKGPSDSVKSLCWYPNGERVMSGLWDRTARVCDVDSGGSVQGLTPIETGYQHVYAMSYSPNTTLAI
ncbi:WD40 repeat-like protein [Suillus decipiens]|nr:WD40 repeat-like protein [Suillus decipiens]